MIYNSELSARAIGVRWRHLKLVWDALGCTIRGGCWTNNARVGPRRLRNDRSAAAGLSGQVSKLGSGTASPACNNILQESWSFYLFLSLCLSLRRSAGALLVLSERWKHSSRSEEKTTYFAAISGAKGVLGSVLSRTPEGHIVRVLRAGKSRRHLYYYKRFWRGWERWRVSWMRRKRERERFVCVRHCFCQDQNLESSATLLPAKLYFTLFAKFTLWGSNLATCIFYTQQGAIFIPVRVPVPNFTSPSLSLVKFSGWNSIRTRFTPIHSKICVQANSNSFETIWKKFLISFDVGKSRMPWAGVCLGPIVFFSKNMRENLEFFTWSWENYKFYTFSCRRSQFWIFFLE